MNGVCEKCGSKHIIHVDNMDICDNCMSTVVYDDRGEVLSNHITSDSFIEYYKTVRSSVSDDHQIPEHACKKLVSMAIDIPTMLNAYGLCLVNKGDYDNSIKYFRKAIEINPCYGAAYCNIAKAYYANGDYDGMLQNLKYAEKYIFSEDDRYKDFMGEYAYALATKGMIINAEEKLRIAEKYGFDSGDSVRSLMSSSKVSTDNSNEDSYESKGVAKTHTKIENDAIKSENSEKKGLNMNQISIDIHKKKISGDWKKWIWIGIGVAVLLFIFSAKFRNIVLSLIVGAIVIVIIIILIMEFIRDPIGFLDAVLSSSSSSDGGFATNVVGGIRIKQGKDKWGPIVYFIDGNYVRQGKDKWAPIVYYIDGNCIKQGNDRWGTIIYFIDGNCIKQGKDKWAPTVYFIDGNCIKQGKDKWGPTVFYIDRG